MKNQKNGYGYNERLFSGGLRSRLHLARFHWVAAAVKRVQPQARSVLELGCFDGKLIDFLPNKPQRYLGFDANWEGGLEIATARWACTENVRFLKASSPDEMLLEKDERFDIAVVMETFEHVPPPMVPGYLQKISQHLDGHLFVSVPNEKGPVFLAKWLAKRLFSKDVEPYSFSEVVNASLGRMDRVKRREHKGFDSAELIREIEKYFDVVEVSGIAPAFLPVWLSFGIGIVATKPGLPTG